MAPWADVLYACDQAWWRWHFPQVSRLFPGELWTVSGAAREEFGLQWIYGHPQGGGLSKEPHTIHCGKNSGYQAIGLAYLFGCTRITLLGYDFMNSPQGKTHWHGDHPKEARLGNPGKRFRAWNEDMKQLAADLKRTACRVENASRRTALKCFPRVALDEALACSRES